MNKNIYPVRLAILGCFLNGAAAIAQAAPAPNPSQVPEPPQLDEGAEVLTRGPVHEAFATPVTLDPEPGMVVPQQPPDPIEEIPPEVKPEGDSIWIPGYWAWDEDESNFLWVSGTYRVPPPDAQWIPGYWAQVEGGYQWNAGFWSHADSDEVEYLPTPPESIERGPSSPRPSGEHIWVPGSWIWSSGHYAWRPGYWIEPREQWVWVPDHYVWTPGGCIFVPGYWDLVPTLRGMLFAPVYYRDPIYSRAGYRYRPATLLDTALLTVYLFTRPRTCHYYFGDYYDARYVDRGIYPWFSLHEHYYTYDPLYTYYDWSYRRRGLRWEDRVHQWYDYVRDHDDHRPPHTLAQQLRVATQGGDQSKGVLRIGRKLQDVATSKDLSFGLERLTQDEQQRNTDARRALQEFRQQRLRAEKRDGQSIKPGTPENPTQPHRVRIAGLHSELPKKERRIKSPDRPRPPELSREVRTPRRARNAETSRRDQIRRLLDQQRGGKLDRGAQRLNRAAQPKGRSNVPRSQQRKSQPSAGAASKTPRRTAPAKDTPKRSAARPAPQRNKPTTPAKGKEPTSSKPKPEKPTPRESKPKRKTDADSKPKPQRKKEEEKKEEKKKKNDE